MSAETLRDYEENRRRLSQQASVEMEEFFKYQPLLLSPAEFNIFRGEHKIIRFDDQRLLNLVKLYTRFHPSERIEEDPMSNSRFTGWLKENSLDESFLEKGARLLLPHAVDEEGNMNWNCLAVLPQNLQRQLQEASISKMLDPNTQRILHDKVNLVVLGASVGANIALALVAGLGVEHITLVDPKRQDGVGSSRVGNPSYLNHGKFKAAALYHDLLIASPYLQGMVFPIEFGPETASAVFEGMKSDDPEEILVILEEMDSLTAKDYLRRVFREMFAGTGKKAIIFSAADTGIAAVTVIAEEPNDEPYNGNALEFGSDPFAQGANPLAKIMETYGLVTKATSNPNRDDIAIPAELPDSLGRLLKGEINTFEQSGLASRLAAPIVGAMLIAFIEGRLATKKVSVDLRKLTDTNWNQEQFVRKTHGEVLTLQEILGIKPRRKKR